MFPQGSGGSTPPSGTSEPSRLAPRRIPIVPAPERPERSAPDGTADDSIPIWPNLKWALIVMGATIGVWWIAGPIVHWLGIDELAP